MSWKTLKNGENTSVFIIDCLFYGFTQQNIKKFLDLDFTFKKLLKLNEILYFDIEEYNQFIVLLTKKTSTLKLNKLYLKYDALLKRLNIKLKTLLKSNLKTKSTPVLDKLFIELIDDYKDIIFYYFILIIHSEYLKSELSNQLKITLKKGNDEMIEDHIACIYNNLSTYQEKQKKELLSIAFDFSKDSRLVKQITKKTEQLVEQIKKFRKIYTRIKNHSQQYCWINTDINKYGTYDVLEVVKQLKSLAAENPNAQLLSMKEFLVKNKNDYNAIIKSFKNSKNVLRLIKNLEELENKKNNTIAQFLQFQYNINLFFDEIAARHGLTYREMISLTYREIVGFIKLNLLNKDILRNRENEYAVIIEENKLKVLTGYNVQKLKESLTNEDFAF